MSKGPEKSHSENESYLPTDGLSVEQDKELTKLLMLWRGGMISTPVFTEIAKMIPQPIVEVVILRWNQGQVETLLLPRPDDDLVWPGKLHTPGTALRTADFKREDGNPLDGAFERIQHSNEIGQPFIERPIYVSRVHRQGMRGPEVAEVYYAKIENRENPSHFWHPVDALAENDQFIQDQLDHVLEAAKQFASDLSN